MSRVGIAPTRATRTIILLVVGVVFAVPIVAMIEFTLRAGLEGGHDLSHWADIVDPENERRYRALFAGVANSLLLAAVTVAIVVVLLVPTMILVALRFPRLARPLEFVCLVPITVPAVVLVVGLAPVYSVLARTVGTAAWTLAFAYGVTVLPFAHRAIASSLGAIDVVTLSEAARSLGASWARTVVGVIVPNIRRGVLAASVIAVAVVLGEYTIASLLNRQNLQTALVQVSKSDPYVAIIFALLALAFAFVLLFAIARAGSARARRTP